MLSGSEVTFSGIAVAALAAFAAGMINALAGGGTLITFPTLLALGIPEVAANVTNTVALCPGYLGGALAQREDLKGQGRRLSLLVPAGIIGGTAGGFLLVFVSAGLFRIVVPFLILISVFLLAVQERARDWILSRPASAHDGGDGTIRAVLPVGATAVYGGYFGAGQGVLLLSVLGLSVSDSLTRLNALKQCLTFSSNIAAAVFFLFSGLIIWPVAVVMAVCAIAGGVAGGRFAGGVDAGVLRWTVVAIGLVVGLLLLVRLF
jgi:uncharacterized membrane protein YfcA